MRSMHFSLFLRNGNLRQTDNEAPIHRHIGISCQTFVGDTFQQMVAADTRDKTTDGNRRQGWHNKALLLLFKKLSKENFNFVLLLALQYLEHIYVVVEEVFANRGSQQVMRSPCYQ
jgi:hypothetical protein